MNAAPLFEFLLILSLLSIASIDDIRSKKIHNKLLLFLTPFVLISVFLLKGFVGLKVGLLLASLVIFCGIPLQMIRFIGGGDLKLLVVFAVTVPWLGFIYSLAYALIWATFLGLFKIILDKQIKSFLLNIFFLFKFKKMEKNNLHTIPFSICLLLGWLSQYSLTGGFYGLF